MAHTGTIETVSQHPPQDDVPWFPGQNEGHGAPGYPSKFATVRCSLTAMLGRIYYRSDASPVAL